MEAEARKLGTFGGVFTPTLLTILGVIMYLRLGWVIGNGGLIGGIMVIGLAVGITTATGLALSSIATNTRLGAGGPYAIISRSLGLEIGGSVGVPLYISQALAVAMYLFGFREGWLWLFPTHSPLAVDLISFFVVFGIAYRSAELAFKLQYIIMGFIAVSIVLILASPAGWSAGHEPVLFGDWRGSVEDGFRGTSFWGVFAVFFPAATGIMAGANMSGDLKDPRRAIPWGTLSAIALSTVIYIALAVWVSRAATPEEMTENYTVLIDKSLWGPGVLLGLLGATLSSALSSLVGAPRILVALINDRVVPDVGGLSTLSDGEPRRAMIFSGVLVFAALLLRDLNVIAPLLSMFFLIAYCVINVVVLIESSLGLLSYRPTLHLPRVVPLLGAVGCLFAMFIINPAVSLMAVGVVMALYVFIGRQKLSGPGDSRSGIFTAVAEWAAARSVELERDNPRTWRPNLLVPVVDTADVRGNFQLLHELVLPEGSLKLLGIAAGEDVTDTARRIGELTGDFKRAGVFTAWSVLDSADLRTGVVAGLQALRSAFFRPNILFLDLGGLDESDLKHLWAESRRMSVGLSLLARHPRAELGKRAVIHLWLPARLLDSPLREGLSKEGMNLALLTALRLRASWSAQLRLIVVVPDEAARPRAAAWLDALSDLARVPRGVEPIVMVGPLKESFANAPQSDLDILGLPPEPDLDWVRQVVQLTRSTCLFLGDSGSEDAMT